MLSDNKICFASILVPKQLYAVDKYDKNNKKIATYLPQIAPYQRFWINSKFD